MLLLVLLILQEFQAIPLFSKSYINLLSHMHVHNPQILGTYPLYDLIVSDELLIYLYGSGFYILKYFVGYKLLYELNLRLMILINCIKLIN